MGNCYDAQEPQKLSHPFPGALTDESHQEDMYEHALMKSLSSMSYFLPVLLIHNKSSCHMLA